MVMPDVWMRLVVCSALCRPTASRTRASTSAGPAVYRMTSSTPQSVETAVSPPSVTMRTSGASRPVVLRILHRDFAPTRSVRASTKMTSAFGALTSYAGSAGICRTRWLSSSRAGRAGAPPSAELKTRS